MRRLITLALAGYALAQTPCVAQQSASTAVTCDAGPSVTGAQPANLHGDWDFLMVPRGMASFGLMSIGFVGSEYGGALTMSRTAPVVIRTIALTENAIRIVVASGEGDVTFDGKISAKGNFMCGTVTYHDGEKFPMIAHKRPSTYQSRSQAERARQATN